MLKDRISNDQLTTTLPRNVGHRSHSYVTQYPRRTETPASVAILIMASAKNPEDESTRFFEASVGLAIHETYIISQPNRLLPCKYEFSCAAARE